MKEPTLIVFFDGDCLMCSHVVRWVYQRDPAGKISFASLTSDFAKTHQVEAGLPTDLTNPETFVLWNREAQKSYKRSTAAGQLLRELKKPWPLVGRVLLLIPRPLRDFGYRFVARNRMRWFGEAGDCAIPPGDLRGRVLQ